MNFFLLKNHAHKLAQMFKIALYNFYTNKCNGSKKQNLKKNKVIFKKLNFLKLSK